jgi:hypothetical protein
MKVVPQARGRRPQTFTEAVIHVVDTLLQSEHRDYFILGSKGADVSQTKLRFDVRIQ